MTTAEIFDVVFDITTAGLPNVPLAIFGVTLGTFVSLILLVTRRKGWWLGLCFAALWGVLLFVLPLVSNLQLRYAASTGQCERVEGTVTDYVPQPYEGHAPGDNFDVGSRKFEYSNFRLSLGYRRTVAYGGVHLAGRRVRMCVVGDDIVRLEVLRQEWPHVLSTVSFRLMSGDEEEFSKVLYSVTQRMTVRSHPVVWAKDFALSDFDLTIAGSCEGAIADLGPVITEASKDIANRAEIVAAYRSSARCQRSPAPPERSWKAPPPVIAYRSDGGVSMVAGGGPSPVTAVEFPDLSRR